MLFLIQSKHRKENSQTVGLAYSLELKINVRVMLTANINIED